MKTARHTAPRTRPPRAPYVVVAVVCAAMGALAVAAVKPSYVDRPFAVTTTVTVLKPSVTTLTASPTPPMMPARAGSSVTISASSGMTKPTSALVSSNAVSLTSHSG